MPLWHQYNVERNACRQSLDGCSRTNVLSDLWSDLKLMAGGRSIAGTLRKGAELPGGKGLKAEKDENQAALRDTVCFYSFFKKPFLTASCTQRPFWTPPQPLVFPLAAWIERQQPSTKPISGGGAGLTEYQLSIGRCSGAEGSEGSEGSDASGRRRATPDSAARAPLIYFPFFQSFNMSQHMLIVGPRTTKETANSLPSHASRLSPSRPLSFPHHFILRRAE